MKIPFLSLCRRSVRVSQLFRLAAVGGWSTVLSLGIAGTPDDHWEERAKGLSKRASHTAVWTGQEVIFWGGGSQSQWLGDGGRYDPATDHWRLISNVDAPSGRWFHAAVWTGREMIVWGGRASFDSSEVKDDGARYDPANDTWRAISSIGAPSPRSQMAAVWTGREMIVWGGAGIGFANLSEGGRYDPTTDTWRPLPDAMLEGRVEPAAVWTGDEMIVWGGVNIDAEWRSLATGARYNPSTDVWTPLPTPGAPGPATAHTAVWTGREMIIWGGREFPSRAVLNEGKRFSVVANEWRPISSTNAPVGRGYHCAVWTGQEMIVWGGEIADGIFDNTGGRYNPMKDEWTPTSLVNVPPKRFFWRPDLGIWTGAGMIVWGGSDYPEELDSNFYYSPSPLSESARPLKQEALAQLIALRAGVTNHVEGSKLDESIEHLTESLDPDRWIDQNHLQRMGGRKVFDEARHAVHNLVELQQGGKHSIPDATLKAVNTRVLRADRMLAVIAVEEAKAAGAKSRKNDEDKREIERGDADAAGGRYEQAIDHYRNAWSHAIHLKIQAPNRLATGGMRLAFVGVEEETYVVEVSSDLIHWTTLGTAHANAEGEVALDDPFVSQHAARFYRITSP